ncbi:MAG: thioredoxin family protein, partial [Candidatus Woesearchaeota archaeon]
MAGTTLFSKLQIPSLLLGLLLLAFFTTGCSGSSESQIKEPFPSPAGFLDTSSEKIVILMFWGNGCPHCAKEEAFLKKLVNEYPDIEVRSAEVWSNRANAQLYEQLAQRYNVQAKGVPGLFIGDTFISGFGSEETTGKKIREE